MSISQPKSSGNDIAAWFGPFAPAMEYARDAAERSILFWDVLRQRGNAYREHLSETVPHVLQYEPELVVDGRKLERPVNYGLVRIVPSAGVEIDMNRRPFVVVDPRAGHGPGIGGFKADSEIGMALKAGHPCYFVGFLPEPMPGQTIEDIARAEAVFLEKVIELHPQADGKPCVIGNCQAGWAVMILAALRPELFGPIIIAGSPLSYWAGVHGKNPMRYTGGLLGGSWLTALTSDLGAGKFDGAWLVQNFESMNPANTLWTKQYNLYSKIDTEAPRYLEFERWWGGHVNLNAEEIQFIVDELFVGNHLAAGTIKVGDGTTVDLRNIRSPIVVFCSQGDNITPPQQALAWILDLYDDVDDIRSHGQTIVYTVHETVGHLGIFVSGGVARKEHGEFASNIDLIDVLPPGLYEATFEAKSADTASADLVTGEWVMRCEQRTLDDIRALGGNDSADERRFAAAARVSEINLSLYRTFVQPWVRAAVTPAAAETMRQLHPLRLQYELFADSNPFMAPLTAAAEWVRGNRQPANTDNPFLALQQGASKQIVAALDTWRDVRDRFGELMFLSVYGSPLLQAAVGVDPAGTAPLRKAGKDPLHRELLRQRIDQIKARMSEGGLREGAARAAIYVGMARGGADERGLAAVRRLRLEQPGARLTLAQFKAMVREQYFMLLIDPEAALNAIPGMLPADAEERRSAFAAVRQVLAARGEIGGRRANGSNAFASCSASMKRKPPDRPFGKPHSGLSGDSSMLTKDSEIGTLAAIGPVADPPHAKYDRLIARAKEVPAATTVVVHPCDETSLRGAVDAAEAGIIKPILVGPAAKIANVARQFDIDIGPYEIVDAPHSDAAAARGVQLIHEGRGELLMKGSLHTDELMREVTASKTGLRTARRISHVFVMDVPTHSDTLFITDAAINIFPDLDAKRDIIQNAIDLFVQVGLGTPRVAILSAVETVTTKIPSTIDAAALCKMADRGQITGGLLDGPLAFDNAIDPEAARIKGITSPVAGRAQILVVPDLEAGNMLAKNLTFLARADAAGIVLGARVPIVLTSRADSVRARMASCAVAVLYAHARRQTTAVPAA